GQGLPELSTWTPRVRGRVSEHRGRHVGLPAIRGTTLLCEAPPGGSDHRADVRRIGSQSVREVAGGGAWPSPDGVRDRWSRPGAREDATAYGRKARSSRSDPAQR